MKRVTGYISTRPLGSYDFEFFVEDSVTDQEIKQKVEDMLEFSMDYQVEEGYIAEQQTVYRKKYPWEEN
jgi:hypothetical protein